MWRLIPVPPRRAGAVALGATLLLLLLGLLGAVSLHRGRPLAMPAWPAAAPFLPPSDTTFIYGWVVDSASPTGRNYVEQITIPVASASSTGCRSPTVRLVAPIGWTASRASGMARTSSGPPTSTA